jgi:hypothetical protein
LDSRVFEGFSNVIAGGMPPNSFSLFANEALFEYFSVAQLTRIITELPPLSAVEQIRIGLEPVNAFSSFLGVIIKKSPVKIEAQKSKSIPVIPHVSSGSSLSNLTHTEKSTEKLLSPSGTFQFTKWTRKIISYADITIIKNIIWQALSQSMRFANLVKKIFHFFGSRVMRKKGTLSLPQTETQPVKAAPSMTAAASLIIAPIFRFLASLSQRLNWIHKLSIIAVIILASIFASNITNMQKSNDLMDARVKYDETRSLIEQKFNQIESSELYNNEPRAKELLSEIESLISQLPQPADESQAADKETVLSRFAKSSEKLRKVVQIEPSGALIDFSAIGAGSPEMLTMSDKVVYAVSKESRKAVKIIADSNISTDVSFPASDKPFLAVAGDDQGRLLAFDGDGLSALQPDGDAAALVEFAFDPAKEKSPASIKTYHSRIYALSPAANQIFRHNSLGAGKGFGMQSPWITDGTDISKAVDFSIDDSIFVLMSDGGIARFLLGKKQNFSIETIEPPLEAPSKINLSEDKDFIYILEPSKKRLAVFGYDGKFKQQYAFEADIKDAVVHRPTKTIFYISGSTVHKAPATHF